MKTEPEPDKTYTLIELLEPPKRKKYHLFDAIHAPAFFEDWRPNPFPKGGWKRTTDKVKMVSRQIDVWIGIFLWGVILTIVGVVLTLAYMVASRG